MTSEEGKEESKEEGPKSEAGIGRKSDSPMTVLSCEALKESLTRVPLQKNLKENSEVAESPPKANGTASGPSSPRGDENGEFSRPSSPETPVNSLGSSKSPLCDSGGNGWHSSISSGVTLKDDSKATEGRTLPPGEDTPPEIKEEEETKSELIAEGSSFKVVESEEKAQGVDSPESPLSPLSLEENLLQGAEDDMEDDEEFSEEKLLQESKDEEDEEKNKGEERNADEVRNNLFNDSEDKVEDDVVEGLRQDKEIEKILKNLDSSLTSASIGKNDKEAAVDPPSLEGDFTRFSHGRPKSSLSNSLPTPEENSIGEKASDMRTLYPQRRLKSPLSKSLPTPDENSNGEKSSDKRSLPSDFSSKDKNVSFKLFRKQTINEEANEGDQYIESDKTPTKGHKVSASKPTLSFTEALKSIAIEDRLLSLDQPSAPVPLVPSIEVPGDVLTPSASLTVLEPVTPPLGERGNKRSAEDTLAFKPDLKKVRVFKQPVDEPKKPMEPTKTPAVGKESCERIGLLTELSKQMNHVKTMESRLQEEKALQESKRAKDCPRVQEKMKTVFIDEKELERRTVQEMRDSVSVSRKMKRIKRKDLESLVIDLFVDKVLYEHQLGTQKDLCKRLEATLETNRKKAAQFHKEVEDLKKVTQRLQAEHIARKNQVIAPVKVKRSVGIQATPTIIGKGLMHTSSTGSIRVLSASPGNPTWTSQVSHSRSNPPPKSADLLSFNHTATQSTPNGTTTVRLMPNANELVKVSQLQPTRVVSTQPLTLSSPPVSTATQMVMVNPVVVQSQNGSVGSPILPVGTTRLVRTPLTPLSASALATSSAQHTISAVPKTSSSVIDLTDDEEASKSSRAATVPPGSVLALQRATGGVSLGTSAPGQFVTLNPPTSVGQLVLVPSAPGQPTTALVVGSVASSPTMLTTGATAVRSAVMTPATRFPTASAIPSVPTRVVVNGNFVPQLSQATRHPAPLPRAPPQQTSGYSKKLPAVPILKLSHKDNSIVLSWNMARSEEHERVASYQLYAYQEGTMPPVPSLWKKVGSVKALELPMACTLTQFMPGHVYHFAVRAVDIRSRLGPFSEPRSIRLGK